jgi:hypothetical protein
MSAKSPKETGAVVCTNVLYDERNQMPSIKAYILNGFFAVSIEVI